MRQVLLVVITLCTFVKNSHCSYNWDWFDVDLSTFDDIHEGNRDEVDYVENLVEQANRNAQTAPFGVGNAEQHRTYSKGSIEFGTYDFIIVGAGSSGCVVANRLSEVKEWNILLLEAGSFGDNLTDIPNMYFPVEFTEYNWGYLSTPQKSACLGMENRQCPLARGKGIGGTSLINGLVYSRGHMEDFDRWEALGNPGWSYDGVLPYFIKAENFNPPEIPSPIDPYVHGQSGPLNVEFHRPQHVQQQAFVEANEEIGVPHDDYNSNKISVSSAQITTINGRRHDTGKAYIQPILGKRTNLHVVPNAYVTRIILNSKRSQHDKGSALGVTFTHEGNDYFAYVNKDVIVSAGAYNTPHLLMLSGVGPQYHLESVGINVHTDLEVGSKLKDHAAFYGVTFDTDYNEPIRPQRQYVREYLQGRGPLATPGNNEGVAFYESTYTMGTGYPDIEIMMIPANATTDLSQRAFRLTDQIYQDLWAYNNRTSSIVMYIICLHCESTGTVRLKSDDPFDYPIIDPQFLSDEGGKDIQLLYEGVQIALELSKTEAFQKMNTRLQGGPLRPCAHHRYLSKAYWYCAIRQVTMDIYHPVSTCPMGPSPEHGDVVDASLKVHGFNNLRVIDVSVFPFTLAGHPNAPAIMLGEKGSDIIKQEYGKLSKW